MHRAVARRISLFISYFVPQYFARSKSSFRPWW